jgi:hypothetical protein
MFSISSDSLRLPLICIITIVETSIVEISAFSHLEVLVVTVIGHYIYMVLCAMYNLDISSATATHKLQCRRELLTSDWLLLLFSTVVLDLDEFS